MQKKKTKSKASMTFFGFVIFVLVFIGVWTVVKLGVGTIKDLSSDEKLKEKYEDYLSTVIMNDPDAFDDITGAENEQLISIAIWTLLESDTAPDDYEYVDAGMLVPVADVEKTFTQLFSSEVTPLHCDVDAGGGIQFKYDETRKAYIVPITGIAPIYSPDVVEINKKGTTVILTVAYLASSDWQQAADGSMIPPAPSKYMKVSLREAADEQMYISSLRSASMPDYVMQSGDSDSSAAVSEDTQSQQQTEKKTGTDK